MKIRIVRINFDRLRILMNDQFIVALPYITQLQANSCERFKNHDRFYQLTGHQSNMLEHHCYDVVWICRRNTRMFWGGREFIDIILHVPRFKQLYLLYIAEPGSATTTTTSPSVYLTRIPLASCGKRHPSLIHEQSRDEQK